MVAFQNYSRVIRIGLVAFLSLFFVGCGGGGDISRDNSDGGDTTTPTLQIAMAITNTNSGESSNQLSASTPLTISATVTNSSGNAVVDQLVTFSFSSPDLASFNPESGTGLTDSSGVANINILVGTIAGDGLVTATLSSGETATIGFSSAGDFTQEVKVITLSVISKVTGLVDNDLSSDNPLQVSANVVDSAGLAVVDEVITFSFSEADLAFFEPATGTALTTADGEAVIDITVGEQAGAGKVIATLASGETAEIGFVSAGGGTLVAETPASLDLFTSAIQLSSSGSEQIELIALVKNDQNILLDGVTVSFSATSGELQISQGTTAADGTARAILSSQNNPENRTLTIAAEVGSLRKEVAIDVVGTGVRINGPASAILNDSAELTIVVADSDGNGIPNQQVTVGSSNGNGLSDTTPITDETGQLTINLTALNPGVDVISATALNATGTLNVSVQRDQFSFTDIPVAEIALNTPQPIGISWSREDVPFVGGQVTLSTTRGVLTSMSGQTDGNGQLQVSVSSSNAGAATLLAQGIDTEGNVVNARADIEFIATEVDNILIEASPNSLGPDGQKSTITAVLRDPLGNLVKNKTVNFTADDVSGGTISPATVVTDSNGLASTVYTSNTVTSEDAITITATELDSGIQAATTLTVADRALFISLGTGNIIESPDDASYLKRFAVFVTDANSNPVSDVQLTISGTPAKYSDLLDPNASLGDPNYQVIRAAFTKGYWTPFPSSDAFEYWVPVQTIGCANEDIDDDAILDVGEDINGDGNLSPGNIVAIDGIVTTDENGQALIELRYPKTYAAWVVVNITASTQVAGSESRVSQYYTLGASAEDLAIESTPPNVNPFGDGRNFIDDPANPGSSIDDGAALTCTNVL